MSQRGTIETMDGAQGTGENAKRWTAVRGFQWYHSTFYMRTAVSTMSSKASTSSNDLLLSRQIPPPGARTARNLHGEKLLLHSLQSTTTRRKTDPKPRRNYKQKYAYHKEVRKIGLDHVKASKKRWMREVWGDTVYIISTICHSNTKIGGC